MPEMPSLNMAWPFHSGTNSSYSYLHKNCIRLHQQDQPPCSTDWFQWVTKKEERKGKKKGHQEGRGMG